jgi:hypothetical protein
MSTDYSQAWKVYFTLCASSQDRKDARKHAASRLKPEHLPAYGRVTWLKSKKDGTLSSQTLNQLKDIPFAAGAHWYPEIADDSSDSEVSNDEGSLKRKQLFSATPSSVKSEVRPSIPIPIPNYVL